MKNRYIKQILAFLSAIMLGQVAWGQTSDAPTQTLCFGTVQPYCVDCAENDSLGTPGSTYTWTIISGPGVPGITGNGENDITIDWSTVPAGDYVLQVLETNATCQGDLSTLNITISPLLEAFITPAATPICSGASALFNITGPAGGTVVISVSGTEYTITLDGSGAGTHTVLNATADVTADLVSVSNGTCSNPVTGSATVEISPLLVAQIVTPVVSPICYEADALFNFTGTPNTTLSITVNGTAQLVNIGAGGTGTYIAPLAIEDQIIVLDSISNGTCTNVVTGTATVEVNPLLEATVVEVLTPICYNDTANFTVTGPANGTVTLTLNGASQNIAIDANGNGTASFPNATSTVTASLVSVTDGTCTNTVTGSAVVLVNPLLQASVTAITPICSGQDAVFNVTGPANGTLTYNINGGANATVDFDGAGNGTILVEAVTADQTVNLVSVTDGTCTNDVTDSDTVVINDLLEAFIAPAATPICSGASAVFNITGPANGTVVISVAGTEYTITLDGSGAGTHTVLNATAAVTADLVSVSNGICSNAVTGSAIVDIRPLLVASILPPTTPICFEDDAEFAFTGTPNTTLNITVNNAPQSVTIDGTGAGSLTIPAAIVDQTVVLVSITDGICTNVVAGTQTVAVNPQVTTSGIFHN
jgi:hypothetical protein